jgi:ATP phosphoribosyltransferase
VIARSSTPAAGSGTRPDSAETDGSTRRMTLAVPNKGRLVEPTLALLHDAGLVFEERDRSLVARVENVDLDILFVRTNDVIEFVGDGVADLGITGGDLLAETGSPLPIVRPLGYGRCALTAAVPRGAPQAAITDLAGLRIATAHPGATRRWFAEQQIPVEVIALSGAVEVAPRLGLAEAIVDLVSTGATLVTNGLRAIGTILRSEAVLVGNPAAMAARAADVDRLVTMLGAVLEGRKRKYLMMNAPATHLQELEALLPGLESPSVIPLAHAGMIAIHAVVGANDVWGLLPRLKAAGASGILVLPIEKLIP